MRGAGGAAGLEPLWQDHLEHEQHAIRIHRHTARSQDGARPRVIPVGSRTNAVLQLLVVNSLRELLTTAFEVNLSLISVDENQEMKRLAEFSVEQNRDTRRLASWAAIIAVPTMIAGIHGMNFQQLPELGWSFGYPLVLALMALTCLGLFAGFKRSGWL